MKRGADARSASPQRIGVFGGTFDPPHLGHVSVVRDVADVLGLDQVLWIPARRSPHKPDQALAPARVRLEMVRVACANELRFGVDATELERPPPSYTIDTLEVIRDRRPEATLYLIIGVDQFRAFHTWRQPERIRELATLAVMDRDGQPAVESDSESTAASGPGPMVAVPVRRVDISSTRVRARVAAGLSVEGLVPAGVERIIEREGLYRRPHR